MSAVCPSCGVAVVPGYVRCPRCHAGIGRSRRSTAEPGGTALAPKGFPISAVLVAVGVAAAIILVFGFHTTNKKTDAAPAPPATPIEAVGSAAPPPRGPIVAPTAPAPAPAAVAPVTQDPGGAAARLEDVLRRQRLWGRAEITGARLDLRSGSCGDKAMRPAIDGEAPVLRGAGLTRLRCLEQSGAVVFERDL